jgi:hypothetical protein
MRSTVVLLIASLLPGFAGAQDLSTAEALKPAARPNILIILADDLGYADLGCQGSPDIPTPHIDSLAKNGVRFTSAYVTSNMCSPSRAGLLTGRSQSRFGHEINWEPVPGKEHCGLPLTEKTMADQLKAADYRTGMVGKWHLGESPQFHPNKRGFEEFFGFVGGGHHYYCDQLKANPPRSKASPYYTLIERNGVPENTTGYPREWDEGAFIGNGIQGIMICKSDPRSLQFELGRTDVSDYRPKEKRFDFRLPIGKFHLQAKSEIRTERMRLDLRNAEVRGEIHTEKGGITWVARAPRQPALAPPQLLSPCPIRYAAEPLRRRPLSHPEGRGQRLPA